MVHSRLRLNDFLKDHSFKVPQHHRRGHRSPFALRARRSAWRRLHRGCQQSGAKVRPHKEDGIAGGMIEMFEGAPLARSARLACVPACQGQVRAEWPDSNSLDTEQPRD
jgi:hypothetical protein